MNAIGGFEMKEFKRILFPVDLSESPEKIVPYVQTVAEKFESKIYLLFGARVFDYFTRIWSSGALMAVRAWIK
jgi:hypothetical protein